MSTSTENSSSWPELRTGPIVTGAALFGAGALIALAGLAVGGAHLFAATRRWIQQMEVPPSEQARIKWAQAKTRRCRRRRRLAERHLGSRGRSGPDTRAAWP